MASLSVPTKRTPERKTVCDPASGSGRLLLQVGKRQPHWEFTGQDSDHRCAQMTALNLGLNGLFGWAVWMNTLTLETHRVYKIGMHLRGPHLGVIREIPVEDSPFHYQSMHQQPKRDPRISTGERELPKDESKGQQLDLF